jgi:hypothetical protein
VSETANYRTELTSRIRSATEDFGWAVRSLTARQLHYTPSEAEWSVHQNAAHVRDMEERVYLPLLRWATVPEMLDPSNYNRQEWLEQRYDDEETIQDLLQDVERMRDEEFGIYRDMDDVVWTRYRTDTRWGPLSCQWIAELMYRHMLDHQQAVMGLRQDIHLAAMAPANPGIIGGTTQ